MTHSKRTLMIFAGIGLLIVGGVLVAVKTNIGSGQSGQDVSSSNAGVHGPKISERDDRNARSDFENELRQLIESDIDHIEKTKQLVASLEEVHQAKKWLLTAKSETGEDLLEDEVVSISNILALEGYIREHLSWAIWEWYKESPNDAVAYADSIANEAIQAYTLEVIILKLYTHGSDDVFEKALELAKLQPVGQSESAVSHSVLYSLAARRSPKDFLRVYEVLKDSLLDYPDLYTGYEANCDFGEGYPYREMLSTVKDIKASWSEDRYLPVNSKGLLLTWAEYEPDAAYEWFLQNSDEVQLSDYIKGYKLSKTASPRKLGKIVADWDAHHKTPESRARAFQVAITSADANEVMDAYFEQLGVDGNRDAHFFEILESFKDLEPYGPTDPFDESPDACFTVLNAMSSNARMTYVLRGGEIGRYDAESTIALFKGLGHSDEDIKRLENHFSNAE